MLGRRRLFEGEARRVDAVTLSGRRGAIVEQMSQMPAATRTLHLDAIHAVAMIGYEFDSLRVDGREETGPAGSRIELCV